MLAGKGRKKYELTARKMAPGIGERAPLTHPANNPQVLHFHFFYKET